MSWRRWVAAWNLFQAIYSAAHPGASLLLAKHFAVVRKLSQQNRGWRHYDSSFRLRVSKGILAWGDNQPELLAEARDLSEEGENTADNLTQNWLANSTVNLPAGVCKRYQKGGFCNFARKCRFQHSCCNCLGQHPFVQCSTPFTGQFKVLPRFRNLRAPTQPARTQAQPNQDMPFRAQQQQSGPQRSHPKPRLPAARTTTHA